jgi:predicted O-methyltransferase YrrM
MTTGATLQKFQFCPVLLDMLKTRRVVGRSGKVFEGSHAVSTPNNLVMLRRLMLEMKAERTLEVGLSLGGSALVFTATHRDLGHAGRHEHAAIDPYQSTVWDSAAIVALERANLLDHLEFKAGLSALELPKLVEAKQSFDLIYIDGSHIVEDVFVDAYFAVQLLSDDGIVAFDDCYSPHIAKVLRFIRRNLRAGLTEIDLLQYRDASSAQKLKYRLARLMGKTQMAAFRRIGNTARNWDAPYREF